MHGYPQFWILITHTKISFSCKVLNGVQMRRTHAYQQNDAHVYVTLCLLVGRYAHSLITGFLILNYQLSSRINAKTVNVLFPLSAGYSLTTGVILNVCKLTDTRCKRQSAKSRSYFFNISTNFAAYFLESINLLASFLSPALNLRHIVSRKYNILINLLKEMKRDRFQTNQCIYLLPSSVITLHQY